MSRSNEAIAYLKQVGFTDEEITRMLHEIGETDTVVVDGKIKTRTESARVNSIVEIREAIRLEASNYLKTSFFGEGDTADGIKVVMGVIEEKLDQAERGELPKTKEKQ